MKAIHEFFVSHLNQKLFILGVLLVVGVIVTILRKISAANSSMAKEKMIKNFKHDPTLAAGFVQSIDIPYRKIENVTHAEFRSLILSIAEHKYLDGWWIDYAQLIAKDKFLVLAHIGFESFGTGLTGQPDNIKLINHHDFFIRHNSEKSELIIFSNLHSNSDGKFQKESFANIIESNPILR